MHQNKRDYFDEQVDWVLEQLPPHILNILAVVPLHVEDQPSKRLMRELNIESPEDICGYYNGWLGILGSGNVYRVPEPTQTYIKIFRRGILAEARDEEGKIWRNQLREQIRITVLHELAHLHGIEEEEITALGYG